VSEATRFEVMSYSEAKALSTQHAFAVITNAGQSAQSIINSILLAAAGASLDSLNTVLPGYLRKNGGLATVFKELDISDVDSIIETELANDYANIITCMKAGLGQGVGSLEANLYETLNGTNAMLQSYRGLVQKIAIDPYISRWAYDAYRPNIASDETAWFMKRIGAITEDQYKTCVHQSGWDDSWITALEMAWTSAAPIGILLDLTRRAKIDDATLSDQLRRYRLSDGMVEAVKDLTVQYPEPYRLAEIHSKGLTTNEEYLSVTRKFGLENGWSLLWAEGQMRYPDFTTALALLRRGDIDEDTFYYWMQRDQVGPGETEAMLKLKDVIPPIQDLIRFAVREAYGDHSSEVQYPAMVDIAKKMGLTEQASEWYWYAHWDRIPVNLMFANYHRGLWDTTKLEHMLKIVDVHPDDRKDIINVAYSPPSIREMGYGFDVGVYTLEDIKRFRRWGGLSPTDAEKAGEAMVAYRTEAERNSVRTELMYAYGFDRITKDELESRLATLPTPIEAIDLWIERAELYRERVLKPTTDVEGRTVSSSEALTAFKLGLRDEAWTRAMLAKLFWTVERIDTAVERAKLEIEQDKAKLEEVKYRKLTIAQITNSYKLKLITRDEMTTEFVIIGYSADDAALLTEVYTAPEAITAAVKNYTITDAVKLYRYQLFDELDIYSNYLLEGYDDVHASMLTLMTKLDYDYPILANLYEKGYINLEQIMAELKKMGLDDYHAKLLIDRTMYTYGVSRLASEKDLTKAEILKGAKNNVFNITQAVGLLEGIGYDENEAYYLLAINKVIAAGDPDGYWDMRKVTEQYKKARGEKYVDVPDELIMLEKQLKDAKAKLDELKKTPEKEEEIKEAALALNTIEQRMRELISTLGLK